MRKGGNMPVAAPIVDGKLQETATNNPITDAYKKKGGSTLDKDAFLQLLVAQMKYQDPLEPTSNTEFISQYATFSELEQMQNVSNSTDLQRATSLVGKTVGVRVYDSVGNYSVRYGVVDYVQIENGKAFLSIGEEYYPLEDVEAVIDPKYTEASDKAMEFLSKFQKLPSLKLLTAEHADTVYELYKTYEEMTDYEKSFIGVDTAKMLKEYVEKMDGITGVTAAKEKAKEFTENLKKLPKLADITLGDEAAINEINAAYEKLTEKEKEYVTKETKDLLQSYLDKLAELKK